MTIKEMHLYDHFIIEGPDSMGKSSLINNILDHYGYHHYIHYEKPKKLNYYNNDLKEFQENSFYEGFKLLNTSIRTIYDRFQLGEFVYSSMYRNYSGEYVFEMEQECMTLDAHKNTKLILLISSDLSFIENDGGNFDFSRLEEEQNRFIEAFNRSLFLNKVMIDVHSKDHSGFKPFEEIFKEAIQ